MSAGHVIVFLFAIVTSSSSLDVTMGVFFSQSSLTSSWSFSRMGAAVSFSIDELRNNSLIGDDVNFNIIQLFVKSGNVWVTGTTVNLWLDKVDVIIGPSYSPEALSTAWMTSYFNIPHLSWGATDSILSDKKEFTTLIRTMGDFAQFSKAMSEVFRRYNWTLCATFYRESGACWYAMKDFYSAGIQKYGLKISETILWNQDLADDAITTGLLRIQERARVVLVCGSTGDMRRILIQAHRLGMTNGDYVFITYGLLADSAPERPWYLADDPENDLAQEAYKSVIHLSWAKGTDSDHSHFTATMLEDQHADRLAEPPWNFTEPKARGIKASYIAGYLYDCIYLYGMLLNESLQNNLDYRNGELLFNLSKGKSFSGITGYVHMDEDGDRQPDYWLWGYDDVTGKKYVALHIRVHQETDTVTQLAPIIWETPDGRPPPDTPKCGFFGELCPFDPTLRNNIIIGIMVPLVLISITAVVINHQYRKKKAEEAMSRMLWRVDYSDIKFSKYRRGLGSQASFVSMNTSHLTLDEGTDQRVDDHQLFTLIAQYKNLVVAVRNIRRDHLVLTRPDHWELNKNPTWYPKTQLPPKGYDETNFELWTPNLPFTATMKELSHDNINPFIGACIDHPNYCILYMYCTKGSLLDIVENDDIKLDNVFKASLIQDLTNGLHFLHASFLKSYGRLKSSNCVIDSRWTLKITDYGLNNIKSNEKVDADVGEYEKYRGMWWTAPELLRLSALPLNGTQKGDVFSYAIILYEIGFRTLPYATDTISPKDIVEKVRNPGGPPFRPSIPAEDAGSYRELVWLMKQAWQESPDIRPDMTWVKKKIKNINKGKNFNIIDHMVHMMEKYTNNLEELVEQRTVQLIEEKKKTDGLLNSMLPPEVADKLKTGEIVPPRMYDSATVFFSDIVGFTTISAMSEPIEIVDFLNDVYSLFDGILKKFDVYKVETVGDSYMVVSGIPRINERHAGEIADMALTLLSAVLRTTIRHLPRIQLQVRIGMHTGPCCAGVVGLAMPRFCLFGDTVNTTSRMETNGKGLRIHVSQQAFNALSLLGDYILEKRGEIQIKVLAGTKTNVIVSREYDYRRYSNGMITVTYRPEEPSLPVRIFRKIRNFWNTSIVTHDKTTVGSSSYNFRNLETNTDIDIPKERLLPIQGLENPADGFVQFLGQLSGNFGSSTSNGSLWSRTSSVSQVVAELLSDSIYGTQGSLPTVSELASLRELDQSLSHFYQRSAVFPMSSELAFLTGRLTPSYQSSDSLQTVSALWRSTQCNQSSDMMSPTVSALAVFPTSSELAFLAGRLTPSDASSDTCSPTVSALWRNTQQNQSSDIMSPTVSALAYWSEASGQILSRQSSIVSCKVYNLASDRLLGFNLYRYFNQPSTTSAPCSEMLLPTVSALWRSTQCNQSSDIMSPTVSALACWREASGQILSRQSSIVSCEAYNLASDRVLGFNFYRYFNQPSPTSAPCSEMLLPTVSALWRSTQCNQSSDIMLPTVSALAWSSTELSGQSLSPKSDSMLSSNVYLSTNREVSSNVHFSTISSIVSELGSNPVLTSEVAKIFMAKTEDLDHPLEVVGIPVLGNDAIQRASPVFEENALGAGTFGSVVKTLLNHDGGKVEVAVKYFNVFHLDENVLYEAIAMEARLQHLAYQIGVGVKCYGVVPVAEEDYSPVALVMEYVNGQTLYESLRAGTLAEAYQTVFKVACQLATAVKALHSYHIIHNDLNLNNVMISLGDEVLLKIIDFGTSSFRHGTRYQVSPEMKDKLWYAPEVRAGGETSKASDIWSVGFLLETLTHATRVYDLTDVYTFCQEEFPEHRPSAEELEEFVYSFLDVT